MEHRDEVHLAETDRRDRLHVDEVSRRDHLHVDELELLTRALDSRDVIGQAKGVIIVTMGCNSTEAFRLLREQSQHENPKLVDVASEVVQRAQRRRAG